MKNPLVSIILATRNRFNLVDKSIQSVLSQSFQDWELIVIDDASEDKTLELIQNWQQKDRRIICLRNKENLGIAKSSNKGLKQAGGKYIAIIDDDDYWACNDKLKRQISFLESHPDYIGVGGGLIIVNKEGKEIGRVLKPETDRTIRKKALFANPMANSTTVFLKEAAEKIGFYDESFKVAHDWDFWLKMGRVGKIYNFQDYFSYYLMAGQNISFVKQKENLRNGIRIIQRHKNYYPTSKLAVFFAHIQYFYTFLPFQIRQKLNPILSCFKKKIFSQKSVQKNL